MMPHLLRREYAIAADLGRRATGLAPGFTANWKLYLSALGHLGRVEEAAAACRQLLRLEPGLTVSEAVRRSPLVQERDLGSVRDRPEAGGLATLRPLSLPARPSKALS
jgi:hypothetical protein